MKFRINQKSIDNLSNYFILMDNIILLLFNSKIGSQKYKEFDLKFFFFGQTFDLKFI